MAVIKTNLESKQTLPFSKLFKGALSRPLCNSRNGWSWQYIHVFLFVFPGFCGKHQCVRQCWGGEWKTLLIFSLREGRPLLIVCRCFTCMCVNNARREGSRASWPHSEESGVLTLLFRSVVFIGLTDFVAFCDSTFLTFMVSLKASFFGHAQLRLLILAEKTHLEWH